VYLVVLIFTALILSKKTTTQLQPSPFPNLPWNLLEVTVIFIVIEGFQSLMSNGFEAFAGSRARELGELLSFPVALAGLCVFFFFSLGPQRAISFFGLNHRMGVLQILFGIRWTLIYFSCLFLFSAGILGIEGLTEEHFKIAQHQWGTLGPSGYVFQVFAKVLTGPTLEEFMFRGLLYATLRQKISMWPAIMISSLLFMFAHGINSYANLFIGIFLCLFVEKGHSLLPAISAHISHNLFVSALSIPLILTVPSSIYVYSSLGVGLLSIIGLLFVEKWIRKHRNLPLQWDFVWSVPR
jgi:membrane protease YdiL (CAAX protease family)